MSPSEEQPSLEARRDALRTRLADAARRANELAAAVQDRDAVERELADVEVRLAQRGRRRLSVLDDVRIAAPCDARWEDMAGDDQVRFCGHCEKNVYNLSAMTRDEAAGLLLEKEGRVCVRFYQRDDGTVLTADCPVGVRRQRRRRVAYGLAGAGIMAATAAFAAGRAGGTVQGEMAIPATATPFATPPEPTAVPPPEPTTVRPATTDAARPMMGAVAIDPSAPAPTPRMGRPSMAPGTQR